MADHSSRTTIFLTHAAPEDNEFSLWLASKLALAGYRVWIDRKRLRGGDDSWDEIDRVLRNEAIKQIVVFTTNVGKPGVKKELAIGDVMKGRLSDPKFMIAVRNADVAYGDAPPELLRENIINGHPNWHDCLKPLFETLDDFGVPKATTPDADILRAIVDAREEGRRFVISRPEAVLTNWFPVTPPERMRYFRLEGMQDQTNAWLRDCKVPFVPMGLLAGTFADPAGFALSSSFDLSTPTAYDIPFGDFVSGTNLGPYLDKSDASKDTVNLLRQHFAALANARGLLPVEFANKEVGWFFPDNLLQANKIAFDAPDGRRIRRAMSGKFKDLRWHVCLLARPRIWPQLCYRIHANVILSEDGKTPLSGEKTHKKRRRLTRSWWNDVWRDRLLAGMRHLAGESASAPLPAGNETFWLETWPITTELPVSYDATDPPLPREEDEDGNIVPSAALEDRYDDVDESDESSNGEDEA